MKKRFALLFAIAGLTIGAGAPAYADPPPWAPAHGHRAKVVREYNYVYYPAGQVYYQPEQHLWFWMNGGSWQFGVNLPAQYRGYATDGVTVMLNTPRPYTEHVYVEEHYGRPWRERHHEWREREHREHEWREHERREHEHERHEWHEEHRH